MLFDAPLIPGLSMREDILSSEEEKDLIGEIDRTHLSPFRFQGFTGKRLTRSFGWAYDFDNGRFAETDAIPAWLLPAREKAAAFAGLDAAELVHALVIRYDAGAGIGWHRDRPVFDQVVGISLNASAILHFRQRTETGFRRVKLTLPPRSAYHLHGEARSQWEHGIRNQETLRQSITFRTLRLER